MAGAQDQPSTLGGTWGSQDHGDVWVTIIREGCRGPNTAQLLVLSLPSVLCAKLCLFLGGGGMSESPSGPGGPPAGRPACPGCGDRRVPPDPTAPWHLPTQSRPPWNAGPQQPLLRSACRGPQRPRRPQCVPGAHTPILCLPTSLPQTSHPHSCLRSQDTPVSEFSVPGAP